MQGRGAGSRVSAAATLAVLLGSVAGPSAAFADGSALFKQLAGSWRGEGDVVLEDGTRERLSCRGYYVLKSQGDGLSIATLCNSPTQKFEIRSLVAKSGDGLSGQWEERTYHATGQVTGVGTIPSRFSMSSRISFVRRTIAGVQKPHCRA